MIRPRVVCGAALSALLVLIPPPATAGLDAPAPHSAILERLERLHRHDVVASARPDRAVVTAPAARAGFDAPTGIAGAPWSPAGAPLLTLTSPASAPGKALPPRTDGISFPARALDLASAGDVDGNGMTDWIRGEPYFTSGALTQAGHVFIDRRLPGGGISTLEIVGPAAFSSFGASVGCAGDVNGDGFDDVIVGAPHFDGITGRVTVFRGTPFGLTTAGRWILDGAALQDHHGFSVAGAGDVNGDGYDDVIVGAPGASSGPFFSNGRASCYLGSANGLSPTPAWTVNGDLTSQFLGWCVAGNGDVNGDGYADVAVTSPGYSNGQVSEGRVQVFLGGSGGLSTTASFNYESNGANWGADAQVTLPGDMNGDGFGEVVIGLPGGDMGGADDGFLAVYAGSTFPFFMSEIYSINGGPAGMQFGYEVATAGDLNGDGYADFLASGPGFSTGSENGLWVEFFGASNLGPGIPFQGHVGTADTRYGTALAGAGDPGNGRTSSLVGGEILPAVTPDPGTESALGVGANVVTEFPGRTLNEFVDPLLPVRPFAQGSFTETGFGTALAIADVNGDGYDDVIAGGPQFEGPLGSSQGHVNAYYGEPEGFVLPPFAVTPKGPSLDGVPAFHIPDWTFVGPSASSNFGFSVANAGDTNGDGYEDVIVGAVSLTDGESVEGGAFLFLGGADGLALTPEWTTEGNEPSAFHGYAVGSAGDVNQDGYADILVGAPLASPGGVSGAGKVSLYYGSPSGPAHTPARVFVGSAASVHLGGSVNGIGDVDGDGYPEVAVSEVDYGNGQTFEGRVLVYRGGPGGVETLPILSWESNVANAFAGLPVAPAGDVNGDGHADLLVGAYGYSNGEANEGALYLFLGSTLGLGSAPVQTLESNIPDADFGAAAWTVGDLDKDGYGDVIIGAPGIATPPAPSPPPGETGPPLPGGRATIHFGTPGAGLETEARHSYDFYATGFDGEIGRAVAGGGDINGDGWPDILYSAPLASSGKLFQNGVVILGLDNVFARGLPRPTRILKSDNATPIAHGLRSDLPTSFRVQGLARSLMGRGKVRLQWQAKAPNQPLDLSGIGSSSLLRTGIPDFLGSSILLSGNVGGLVSGERYRVRTRFASRHPNFQRSRWFTSHRDGQLEMDLRTAGPTGFTDVEDPIGAPGGLAFAGAAPNPLVAGEGGLLRFVLPAAGPVTIEAWDATGRKVARVFDGAREAGPSSVAWDGRDDAGRALPRGLYFLRLSAAGERRETKVVIAR
jgi:hypothetical protein